MFVLELLVITFYLHLQTLISYIIQSTIIRRQVGGCEMNRQETIIILASFIQIKKYML